MTVPQILSITTNFSCNVLKVFYTFADYQPPANKQRLLTGLA